MKKTLKFLTLLLIFSLLAALSFTISAESDIAVVVDGKKLDFDVPPTIVNGRTLVPLRAIFEALGAEIEWDGTTSTCTAVKDSTTVVITIGADTMYVNGTPKALDAPGQIVKSRTLIPLRAVSEALDCSVSWEGSIRTAVILSDSKNYTTLFAPSGEVAMVGNNEVEEKLLYGWHKVPCGIMYSLDGRVISKPLSEFETYKDLGWYTEPTTSQIVSSGTANSFVWQYTNGLLYLFGKESIDSYPNTPWADYKNDIGTVYIGYGATDIASFTFYDHAVLNRVEISPTVTTIKNYAFDKTNISRIGIPKSVTSFEAYAFDNYAFTNELSCNKNMVIYCEKDSFAEKFAKDNAIQYVYATPVYSPDSRTIMVTDEEKAIYVGNGWYAEPVTTMYSIDGRTLICPVSEIAINKSVGWYEHKYDVYTTMYALDDRTLDVLNMQIPDYQKVGWYLYEDYVSAKADELVLSGGYDCAVAYVESLISSLKYTNTAANFDKLEGKLFSLLANWRIEVGAPMVAISRDLTHSAGYPVAQFTVRNISDKTVKSLEVTFTCFDINQEKTWDDGGSPTIRSTASNTSIAPGETATYTITLYNNTSTHYIDNITAKRIVYTDGSVWEQ